MTSSWSTTAVGMRRLRVARTDNIVAECLERECLSQVFVVMVSGRRQTREKVGRTWYEMDVSLRTRVRGMRLSSKIEGPRRAEPSRIDRLIGRLRNELNSESGGDSTASGAVQVRI